MPKTERPKEISIVNRRAWHEYSIGETYEAGIVLVGTEVKSVRLAKANIRDSFCKVEDGEIILHGMYISPYEQGNRANVDPVRPRKLLLNRQEIRKIDRQLKEKGFTLIPLKLYFSRGYAKVQIALAAGKKLYDRRDALAARDAEREKRQSEARRS